MMSFEFSSTNIEDKDFNRSPVIPRLCVTEGIEMTTADDTPSRHDTASRHDTTSRLGCTDHRIISPDLNTEHKSSTPVPSTTAATSSAPSVHTYHSRGTKVGTISLHLVPIVSLVMDGKERLCLAQISNTLLKNYSYNEIHNRRVALGITCVQCTPVQLEILRRAGAMPASSRRCGMITKREAERLVKSFLDDITPPKLPEDFVFQVEHDCGWGCRGCFLPARYNSSRAKCIRCCYCDVFFSPNKFIFHFHRSASSKYNHPDAANFNSWRRHLKLAEGHSHGEAVLHAWEDVKAMFNGGNRRRLQPTSSVIPGSSSRPHHHHYRRQDADFQKLNQHPALKKPSNSYGKSDATCSISSNNSGCRGRSIGHLLPSPSLPVSQSIYPQMEGQCSPPVLNYCQAATTDFIAARNFNFRSAACTGIPCSDYVTSECDVIKRSGTPIKIDAGFFSGKRPFLTSIDDNDVDDIENKDFLPRQTVQFMTEKEGMADEDDETEGDYDDTNHASISDYNYDGNRDSECESIDVDTVDDDNCVAAIKSAEEMNKSTDETLYNNLEDTMTCPDEPHEETRHSEEHRSGFQYKMPLLEAPVQAVDLISSNNDNSYRCRGPDSSGQSIARNVFGRTMEGEGRRDSTKESFQGQVDDKTRFIGFVRLYWIWFDLFHLIYFFYIWFVWFCLICFVLFDLFHFIWFVSFDLFLLYLIRLGLFDLFRFIWFVSFYLICFVPFDLFCFIRFVSFYLICFLISAMSSIPCLMIKFQVISRNNCSQSNSRSFCLPWNSKCEYPDSRIWSPGHIRESSIENLKHFYLKSFK